VGRAKPAALAVAGSIGLATFVTAPVALTARPSGAAGVPAVRAAATTKKASAKPTRHTPKPTSHAPTVKTTPAPTVTRTVAPKPRCDVANGRPASEMTSAPYPQLMLDFTDVWPLTRGEGVKVAIVDSGVDTSHPQLPSIDTYDVTNTEKKDCVGHGTMVAGIIAAQDLRSGHVPFLGVAPKVHLISVKAATQPDNNDVGPVADGIRRAADLGADVINVSVTLANFAVLKNAVEYAQRKGALIVAAAGNTAKDKKASEQALYPASYDGVMSVGAIDRDGKVTDFTDAKSRVSVVAPGMQVISTWPHNSYNALPGTSFAAPYVTATAALVKAYHPNLAAAQIKHRIEATADGRTSIGSGYGIVNPLRAVTAVLPEENRKAGTGTVRPKPVAIVTPEHKNTFTRTLALSFVGGALGITGAVIAGGIIVPAGRRRNWRPGRRTTPADQEHSD
jgi:type VII secretion-associated serine protease mycosin